MSAARRHLVAARRDALGDGARPTAAAPGDPASRRARRTPAVAIGVRLLWALPAALLAPVACRGRALPPAPVAAAAAPADAGDDAAPEAAAPPPTPARLRAVYRSAHDEARRTIRPDNAAAQLARLSAHIEREREAL